MPINNGLPIGSASGGADSSIDGTEKVPVSGSKYALISSILTYIAAAVATLTNKTIDLTSNTLTGTKAQFNTAMSDADFATLTGTETLTNKSLTSPTLTTPTVSGAITFPDGVRQTFNPDGTNAGINVGSQAGDPSAPSNGDLWYDSTNNTLDARINGATVNLGAGGGAVATDAIWDAKGDLAVGTGANTAAKLTAGANGLVLVTDSAEATGLKWSSVAGTGDVVGPASATDEALARFDSTTGKLIQNGAITMGDTGVLTFPDNVRQTFNPGADAAGLNVGSIAGDPGTPSNGDLWYDSTANELTARINGSSVALGAGGGGRTLIAEVTPTGVTTVTVASSISGSYKKLTLEFAIRSTQATNAVDGYIEFNTDTTAGNYRYNEIHRNAGGQGSGSGANRIFALTGISADSAPANGFAIGKIEIPQYANTNIQKTALASFSMQYDASSVFTQVFTADVLWKNAAAITQIDIALSAGNFASNSVIRLYGES
jgi:hypothetical protein